MMLVHKEDYESLLLQYRDPNSLMYKKLRIVDSYINGGETLLDIGVGIGELIELEKQKFRKIYGIDVDEESVKICRKRFENDENIYIIEGNINDLENLFKDRKFDYITCLDVLEHIKIEECKKALNNIYNLLKDGGKFIFTGPGVFEKIRILLGRSPTHLHSHSSYGWKRMIERAGFDVMNVETVEFPIIHSNFLRKRLHIFGKCCLIVAEKRCR
ncbi:MAG: class I SAM-dependent methyltransferase [Candidatus Marinimicrobia bacterium]|nr:class I SAM-dependent methyltransferase [Candidatus Neomarinimicrobiota bacterium]